MTEETQSVDEQIGTEATIKTTDAPAQNTEGNDLSTGASVTESGAIVSPTKDAISLVSDLEAVGEAVEKLVSDTYEEVKEAIE